MRKPEADGVLLIIDKVIIRELYRDDKKSYTERQASSILAPQRYPRCRYWMALASKLTA
jgi:hypothetical protein